MSWLPWVVGILLTSAFAGCLESPIDKKDVDDAVDRLLGEFVNPISLDHEHDDLAEHQISNHVDLVGRDGIGADGLPPGGVGEIDVVGDYAYVALMNYGFAIIDLQDPAKPKTVARVPVGIPPSPVLFGHYTADLKVDKTGNWVFLALELNYAAGALVYDARDKSSVKLAGFWPSPGKYLGCHMIEYAEIMGQEYLFCAPLDAAIYVGLIQPATPASAREIVTVARWVPVSARYASALAANPAGTASATAGSGHDDMTFQMDPLTGKPTLFVSLWGLGVWFVDVSVPAAPVTLGGWIGDDAKWFRGNIHTTMAFKSEDGKRIVVSIPEVARPPTMFVIDATDFAKPKLLAEWKAMESFVNEAGADVSGTFSMHNFQIVDEKVYLAMYHGGLWVVDLGSPDLRANPQPIASYMPHEARPDDKPYSVGAWDVVVWKGYILTGDSNGGFYVLHREGDPAGDAAYTSFA